MTSPDRDALTDQLIDAGAEIVRRGLVLASGGNLSVRRPGSDSFIVTASGTWLDRLTREDFVEIDADGQVVAQVGDRRPSVEWKLHHHTYAVRPDVEAVIHLHPQHVLLVDLLGAPIRFTTLDHQFYVGSAGRVPFFPAGSPEIAEAAAEAAREHDAVVMAHHGCSTLGPTVEMAVRRALNLEEAAAMTYRLLLAGNTDADFPAQWKGNIVNG